MSKTQVSGFLAALACGALLASPLQAQEVSAVELRALPTQMTVRVVGKDYDTVRGDIRIAARTVCRNARTLGELALDDLNWCVGKSSAKTLRQYRKLLAEGTLAAMDGAILLSAR